MLFAVSIIAIAYSVLGHINVSYFDGAFSAANQNAANKTMRNHWMLTAGMYAFAILVKLF